MARDRRPNIAKKVRRENCVQIGFTGWTRTWNRALFVVGLDLSGWQVDRSLLVS